tara:strand:+ start:840 stop:1244 length:405 start_codon:yes stop_codon:yes gene_type:complete
MRKLIFFCFLIQMGCEYELREDISDWNGTNEEFLLSFDQRNSEELNGTSLLVDKRSGTPFTGEVSRKEDNRETQQTFKSGLLNGKSVKKSSDGSWVEANYQNGRLHGNMIFFNSNGKVRSIMTYEEGKRVISRD